MFKATTLKQPKKRERKKEKVLSEPEEDMYTRASPAEEMIAGSYSPGTTRVFLQELSGEEWPDTATPTLGSSRKTLELQLGSQPVDMGMVFMSGDINEKNTFEGIQTKFLSTLDTKVWQKFLTEFSQKVERRVDAEEIKEEKWEIVVEFGEPIPMGTGLDKEAREELISKTILFCETRPNTEPRSCKNSSTLKRNVKVK